MKYEYESKNDFLDFIERQWVSDFTNWGYKQEQAVKITSNIDSSVALIGSTTNTLKKYLVENNIGKQGRFIVQNCMRTHGLKLLKTSEPQLFGTYFKCMGILAEFSQQNLDNIVCQAFDYLLNGIGIQPIDIRIRINSNDKDLNLSITNIKSSVIREVDTFPAHYYKHSYGNNVGGITGRNFNIAIRQKGTEKFIDIGNVIVMERGTQRCAIEMGFSNLVLSMTCLGMSSTIAASRMADVCAIDSSNKMKFFDAVISTAVLQYEGILPDAHCSRYFKRLVHKYFGSAINFWKDKLLIDDEQILKYMEEFILLEYKDNTFLGVNTWKES